ncbi:DUF4350 domain-containing protein [Algoriphagus litoralis]|uniref:DUF4350 domain-containing protein n=1 Tax=Algoriphagus litoralis TaxID=2202829 RepID=UPI000DBA5F73|nr:DUF4350 domain-containing protein [Algoriphagus litoralis]
MSRGQKILLGSLTFLILVVLLLIFSSPPPVDWSPSYVQDDSRPLGAKVFYDQVKKVDADFREVNSPPYEAIEEAPQEATYVFVNSIFETDPEETEVLLNWVRGGGHLFISASTIPTNFLDSLGIIEDVHPENFEIERRFALSLEKPMILADPVTYDKFHYGEFYEWADSVEVQVLGKISDTSDPDSIGAKPNFIQLKAGNGMVTLHAFPEAFTNYFLLDSTSKFYTEQVLGTWDLDRPILLDQYIKAGKVINTSPLYLVLNNPYLKAAYFTCLVLLVLWVVFEGKRRQKAIKIITPPKNQSLEFAKTISSIYLGRKDMTELGQLQIKLFWDYCRTKFNFQIEESKEEIAISLSNKSGVALDLSENLVKKLRLYEAKPQLNAEDILQIHQLIEDFKSKQIHGRDLQPAG